MGHHKAIASVAKRAPLEYLERETPTAQDNHVLVEVAWTAAGPFNLHIADGMAPSYPQIGSSDVAGVVKSVGPDVKHFSVGDSMFGWSHAKDEEKGWQQYVLLPENSLAKVSFYRTCTLAMRPTNDFSYPQKSLQLKRQRYRQTLSRPTTSLSPTWAWSCHGQSRHRTISPKTMCQS